MGFQNIGPNYWKGEDGRAESDRRQGEVHRPAICRGVQGTRQLGALSGRRLPGADLSGQPEPVLARQGARSIRRLVGHLDLPRPGEVRDGRLPAAAAGRRDGLLHLRPHRHRDGRQRGLEEQGRREEIPGMGGHAGIRDDLRQRAARLLLAVERRRSRSTTISPRRWSAGASSCKSTIRNSYQILSRGTPNLENELWNVSAQVINGKLTPEAAAKQLQDGLDSGTSPAK